MVPENLPGPDRRSAETSTAYHYRVWSYFEKSSVYRRLDITIEQATEDRKQAAKDLFERPRIWRKLGFPKGYLIPKSKCFGENGDFLCKKPHEHDRTIIAGPRDTLRLEMRDMARALAAIAQLSESCAVKNPIRLGMRAPDGFQIHHQKPHQNLPGLRGSETVLEQRQVGRCKLLYSLQQVPLP